MSDDTPVSGKREHEMTQQGDTNVTSAMIRYWCWDCKAYTDIETDVETQELQCLACGCNFVEVSEVSIEDPLSPEKFGNTITSSSNTPVASPHLSPSSPGATSRISSAQSQSNNNIHNHNVGSSAALITPGNASGGANSNSLDSTIQNLFQMLFATRSVLGDSSGGAEYANTVGDYAFGSLQDIIDSLHSAGGSQAPRIGPASKALIASLPRVKIINVAGTPTFDDEEVPPCAICKEAFKEENNDIALEHTNAKCVDTYDDPHTCVAICLPCKHIFHEACATAWLQQSSTCPVCRFHITEMSLQNKVGSKNIGASSTASTAVPQTTTVASDEMNSR